MQCCPLLPQPVDVTAIMLHRAMLVMLSQWQQARAAPSLSPSLRASAAQRSGWIECGRGGMVRPPTLLLCAISPAPPASRSLQPHFGSTSSAISSAASLVGAGRHGGKREDGSALVRGPRPRSRRSKNVLPGRVERPTTSLLKRYSNQLSYGSSAGQTRDALMHPRGLRLSWPFAQDIDWRLFSEGTQQPLCGF